MLGRFNNASMANIESTKIDKQVELTTVSGQWSKQRSKTAGEKSSFDNKKSFF